MSDSLALRTARLATTKSAALIPEPDAVTRSIPASVKRATSWTWITETVAASDTAETGGWVNVDLSTIVAQGATAVKAYIDFKLNGVTQGFVEVRATSSSPTITVLGHESDGDTGVGGQCEFPISAQAFELRVDDPGGGTTVDRYEVRIQAYM